MDISFRTDAGTFNYRVCAMIINEGKILAMKDERSPYYYLPGGRVHLNETVEEAVLREAREELEADIKIDRPLWLNQSFFREDVSGERYHELCLYFLMDISGSDILSRGESFTISENGKKHRFEWLSFERLRDEYFYPIFLKEKIFSLPERLTLLTTSEIE